MMLQKVIPQNHDLSRLIIRIAVGGLMLFHGYAKITGGIDFIFDMLRAAHLPSFLAYGVYVGELLVPMLILLGIQVRLSALIYVINMLFTIVLLGINDDIFSINPLPSGGWSIELNLLFMLGALALLFSGGGKFCILKNEDNPE